MLVVRVLGGFEMRLSDTPVRISRRHVQQLLACLMLERGKSVSRDLLGGFFWPEDERESQLSQLRNVLSRLRELLGKPDYIQQEKGFLAFNTALPYELDATPLLACEFLALNEKSTAELMQISENYHPFLPEFDETWVITQRSRLESIHDERVLRTIVERLLSERQWALLADWGRRAISRPGNQGFEPLYTHVMRAEYHLHNPKGVSDVYAALNAALDELGLVPSRAARELYERMLREEEQLVEPATAPIARAPASAAAPASGAHLAQALPPLHLPDYLRNPPTPLIGRDHLLQRVVHDLADPNRQLITLLGIGGIGKTRLAAAAATTALPKFADGVFFVEVTEARSAESFYALLAESLRFSPYGQASLKQQVLDFLREKHALILVDNFETMLENDDVARKPGRGGSEAGTTRLESRGDAARKPGAALIEELCSKAPSLKVLVTTRQSLQLLRETVFDVDGLDVPSDAEQPDATQHGAVALFAEIAGRVNDRFSLARELPDVVNICHLVGGTPLALEISAALVRGLNCAQIAERITQNLDALISQWRTVSPRQRSLRAVLAYAHSLLAAHEQAVFAQTSVFVGGFTQDAAAEVAGASFSALRALKDCALVRQDVTARYFMHSFVRQFSAEQLLALSDAAAQAAQNRLVQFGLGYAQTHAESQTALEPEWANLLEGMRLAHAQQTWPQVLAYADALSEPWYTAARYGDIRQGMAWAGAAAAALGDERAQSRFLSHWGRACVRQGDYAEADGYFERGLALAWKLIDSPSIARVLYERAQLLIERSELKQADEMLDQCLEIYEELNDKLGLGESYRQKARAQYNSYKLENLLEALSHAKRAFEIMRSHEDERPLIPVIRLLTDISVDLKDFESARNYCDIGRKLTSEHENSREVALLHFSQALLARAISNWQEAIHEANLSLRMLRQIGDRKSCAHVTIVLGYIFLSTNETNKAVNEIGEGISLLRQFHDPLALLWPLLRSGEALLKLNRVEDARNSWEEGLKIAELNQHSLVNTFRDNLSKL